jgi:hypothetical protein
MSVCTLLLSSLPDNWLPFVAPDLGVSAAEADYTACALSNIYVNIHVGWISGALH